MPKTVVVDQNGIVVGQKCPYRVCRTTCDIQLDMFEERFDFQFEEDGKIGRKSLGVFDLVKEVNSHKGEVGLVNCLKLATARGLGEDVFAKKEPGLMVDLSGIDTVDDLIQKQRENDEKLQGFADKFGITVNQLIDIVKSGDLGQLKNTEVKTKIEEKEDE